MQIAEHLLYMHILAEAARPRSLTESDKRRTAQKLKREIKQSNKQIKKSSSRLAQFFSKAKDKLGGAAMAAITLRTREARLFQKELKDAKRRGLSEPKAIARAITKVAGPPRKGETTRTYQQRTDKLLKKIFKNEKVRSAAIKVATGVAISLGSMYLASTLGMFAAVAATQTARAAANAGIDTAAELEATASFAAQNANVDPTPDPEAAEPPTWQGDVEAEVSEIQARAGQVKANADAAQAEVAAARAEVDKTWSARIDTPRDSIEELEAARAAEEAALDRLERATREAERVDSEREALNDQMQRLRDRLTNMERRRR